jgi:hypothetical protein
MNKQLYNIKKIASMNKEALDAAAIAPLITGIPSLVANTHDHIYEPVTNASIALGTAGAGVLGRLAGQRGVAALENNITKNIINKVQGSERFKSILSDLGGQEKNLTKTRDLLQRKLVRAYRDHAPQVRKAFLDARTQAATNLLNNKIKQQAFVKNTPQMLANKVLAKPLMKYGLGALPWLGAVASGYGTHKLLNYLRD